jgi:hypothetical protein
VKTSFQFRTTLALAGLVALGGCETLTPRLDQTYGDAVNTATAQQTLNRDAAAQNARKTVAGIDGPTAKEIVDRYHKSFRNPEPAPSVFAIGVSGGASGGGSGQGGQGQ